MEKFTRYKKIYPSYFSWSEFLAMPVLPIVIISILSYGILYFLGLWPTIAATVIISIVINLYFHGLKRATPNGSMVPHNEIPSIIALLSMLPSLLAILGVLFIANAGVYLIVLYQKTGLSYPYLFAFWCFVMFGTPVSYYLGRKLKYWYSIHYQAYCFTSVPISITYDPESLIVIKEITFLNTKKRRLGTIDLSEQKQSEALPNLDKLSLSKKNELLYKPVYRSLDYIPKHTNVLKISYYSVSEGCFYKDEITFPYNQLKFEQNKYPLNESAFLRGKSTDRIVLRIQKGGEICLYNQYCTLISPTRLTKQVANKEEQEKAFQEYMSSYWLSENNKNTSYHIEKIRASKGLEQRAMLGTATFNWQLTGDGLENHKIMVKDVNNCFLDDDTLEVDVIKKRHLPICFEFSYGFNDWLLIHIDPEKLYEVLSPLQFDDPETIFTFYVSINLEKGNASFVVKNKDKGLPFDAWKKELLHRWKDAKNKKSRHKEYDQKQTILNGILLLMQQKSYSEAQKRCKEAIQQRPDFALIYFYEARLLFYTKGYEASYAQEDYFIEKTKNDPFALSRIYNHYGCLHDEEKHYKESLAYFEKAVQTYPEETIYIANVAEMHYKLNNPSKALHYAKESSDKGYSSHMIDEILRNKGVIH